MPKAALFSDCNLETGNAMNFFQPEGGTGLVMFLRVLIYP